VAKDSAKKSNESDDAGADKSNVQVMQDSFEDNQA
jgi:hypothetical protein